MIRNLALISMLTLTAATTFSTVAQAVPGNVLFDATVEKKCTVVTTQVGTLVSNSFPFPTGFITNQPGKISARCNSEGEVSLSHSQAFTNPSQLAINKSYSPEDTVEGNGIPTTFDISMTATRGGGRLLIPGIYRFTLTATVTPF